jgi:hypothetical protein
VTPKLTPKAGEHQSTNVSEDQFALYLAAYHKTYRDFAEQFFSEEARHELGRYPLLDRGIRAYVSTQFGAGFEYLPPPAEGIVTEHHSQRVEFMFARAPRKLRGVGPMLVVAGSNTTVQGLTLEGGFPFLLGTERSDIRLIDVRFRAGDWTREVLWAELSGDRRADYWSEARAGTRASHELFVAYSQLKSAAIQHLSIHDYVATFKERHVLVLGDYSPAGRARLTAIKEVLGGAGYEPILLDELPDHPAMNLVQKVVAFGSVARFIVIDDSSKSGHLVEAMQVKTNDWITVVLRLDGSDGTYMTKGIEALSTVVKEFLYTPADLPAILSEAIAWSESRNAELSRHWADVYPWRTG